MDDRSYTDAVARRDKLRQELTEVEEFIRLYERIFLKQSAGERGSSEGDMRPTDEQTEPKRKRNPLSPRKIAALARAEIIKNNIPMTRGQLVDALESKGIVLIATDKAKNIGTIMWRFRAEFENIPGRGYWPKDIPLDGRLL